MSRDITEQIDDICEERFGHTNWVIISTLSDQEKVGLDDVADTETIEGVPVAFYFEKRKECCWCGWDYEKDLKDHDQGLLCKKCFDKAQSDPRYYDEEKDEESLEKSIELIDNLISDIYKENGYEDYAQKIIGAWINIKEKLEEKTDE